MTMDPKETASEATAPHGTAALSDKLGALNRIFVRTVKALGDAGQAELACRLAAEAWALIRAERPEEAEKLNGALHYLTHPKRQCKKE